MRAVILRMVGSQHNLSRLTTHHYCHHVPLQHFHHLHNQPYFKMSAAAVEIPPQPLSGQHQAQPTLDEPVLSSADAHKLDASIPPHAWDSHVHIVDEDSFPFGPNAPYRPKKATLADLAAFHRALGLESACLVALSVYGADNSILIEGLKHQQGKGRAVACIDPETVTQEELKTLHEAGVRAIRVNLRSTSAAVDVGALQTAADKVKPFGWAIQIYVALSQVPELAAVVPSLGVPVVIDHLGGPDPNAGPARQQRGHAELLNLLRSGNVWTKLSGTYRFDTLPDLDEFVVEILRIAPERVVWASDWPHTGGVARNPGGDRTKLQDYRAVDDVAFVKQTKAWCVMAEGADRGERLMRKIWVDNPRALWQVGN